MRLAALAFIVTTLTASVAHAADQAVVSICPGRGYLPYDYPTFNSCPCGTDGCFHPRPYYACCGEGDPDYKQAFWRRWLRAHFCGGSMLEGVPRHCVSPPSRAVPMSGPPISDLILPPQPTVTPQDESETPETASPEAESTPAGEPSPFRLKTDPS